MIIEIKSVKDIGSCNFCRRGEVDAERLNSAIQYPYDKVYEIEGRVTGFRMCGHCRKEFFDKMLKLPLIQDREEKAAD